MINTMMYALHALHWYAEIFMNIALGAVRDNYKRAVACYPDLHIEKTITTPFQQFKKR